MSADTDDSSRQVRDPRAPVRLSVTEIDLSGPARPGRLLLDVVEQDRQVAIEQATAWAHVRGYHRLVPSIERVFSKEPPKSGYCALINKPHGLLILVTWPWAPPSM